MLAAVIDKQLHVFISIVDLPVVVAIGERKMGKLVELLLKNKLVKGLEVNKECNNNSQPWVFGG